MAQIVPLTVRKVFQVNGNKSKVPNSKLLGLTLWTASLVLPSLATRLAHIGLVLAPEHAALVTSHMPGEVELIGPVLSATWTPEEKLNL